MAEKKKKGLGLIETRGQFQTKGIVVGVDKDNFYKEMTTRTDKPMRSTSFGVQFDKDATMYVSLNGMEQEYVYFTKSETDPVTQKKITTTESVVWKDRHKFDKEGYRLIGVNLGIKKIKDSRGNDINDKKVLVPYDACKEISENLTDGVSVFIKGNIEYSQFNGKHHINFVPNQISLCRPVDLEADDFAPEALFQQTILFMGIKQTEDKSRFVVEAKIVGYNSIEDAEFYVENSTLASQMRKGLRPYQSIKVHGKIHVQRNMESVEEPDGWGEANKMDRVNAPTTRELIILGADPSTIEKEAYNEEKIDAAIAQINASKKASSDYGDVDGNWGSSAKLNDADADEDEPW